MNSDTALSDWLSVKSRQCNETLWTHYRVRVDAKVRQTCLAPSWAVSVCRASESDKRLWICVIKCQKIHYTYQLSRQPGSSFITESSEAHLPGFDPLPNLPPFSNSCSCFGLAYVILMRNSSMNHWMPEDDDVETEKNERYALSTELTS